MRIIFFGSDDFAAVHLEYLLALKQEIVCCVTGPDKPQGRGMKYTPSPIKEIAVRAHLVCLQPISLKDGASLERLKSFAADIFVVVAYGRLLTQEILDMPRILCLNVHGSLLPRYRGAAPIQWAILNGDSQTGVTIQRMALALDAGDIIAQESLPIDSLENAVQLRARMAVIGARLLGRVLEEKLFNHPVPQDETQVTWAPKLTKEMGEINWKTSPTSIAHQVRALQPWPGAYTFYNGKMLKITACQSTAQKTDNFNPGQVIYTDKNGIYVACQNGTLWIQEVHPQAGKLMPASSFVAGYKIGAGVLLGENL